MNNELLDKLYLNPVQEVNIHRRKLNPIRQRELNRAASEKHSLSSCRSVQNLFKGLNGTVIIQNWNTKKNIPKDIGELLNLPSLIDRKKLMKLEKLDYKKIADKSSEQMSLLDKIKLSTIPQKFQNEETSERDMSNKISIISRPSKSRQLQRSNSMMTYERVRVAKEYIEKKYRLKKVEEQEKKKGKK